MSKYKIVKYFKAKKYSVVSEYENEKCANKICDSMNEAIKKVSPLIYFRVEKI